MNFSVEDMCPVIPKAKRTAELWENIFEMKDHFEAGKFVQTYKSPENITHLPERYGKNSTRSMATHIYYMLKDKEYSPFHQLDSDEMWHWYYGNTLMLFVINQKTGDLRVDYLGPKYGKFVSLIQAGDWFAGKLKDPLPNNYALIGATVSPGFEMVDFRFADPDKLVAEYPQHSKLIKEMSLKKK